MGKDPAFLFYPGDWLGGTIGMTLEEKGAYMELLMLQFNRGHMTKDMIAQTVGHLWVKVQDKFIQDDAGLWYNIRLDSEKEKRRNFVSSRKNNKEGKNQHKKNVGHMTSHMENENRNENTLNNKDSFISDWQSWGNQIVNGTDQYWEQMRGRKVTIDEIDTFISVATRKSWSMPDQQSFRVSLKGFKDTNGHSSPKLNVNKIQ